MPVDLILKNARIYAFGKIVEAGLAVDNGRIVRIAKESNLPSASEKMDLEGLLVLPGLIDVHVHLRDQELSYKEDFYSGTCAAANGGITLVMDMPNNKPTTMSAETLRERMEIASGKIVVNVAFYSAFPKEIREMKEIVDAGAKAFKFFLSHKVGGLDPNDEENTIKAFKEASRLNIPVAVHAEDGALLNESFRRLRSSGREDLDAYLEVHSQEAEVSGIRRAIRLMRNSGAHLHICHVSTSEGLRIIVGAKRSGLSVSCETTPHHILLSSQHMREIGPIALVNPPLRNPSETLYLQRALCNGLIDALASDHAPHSLTEKESSSVWEISAGIAGIETMLPLMLTMVNKGLLTIPDLARLMAENPAKIFGFRGRGSIIEGNYADLVVVDLKREWTIDPSEFYSKAKFSPFEGWNVRGKPVKTFVGGNLVMEDGEIVAKPGSGRIIR
ncbi:MAG: dihydroorotase family protein [Candidatus Bathyarchaeia archaeon]